ncbi:MAG: M28 family metallopeptidase [Phycisphaerales bacterium]
MNTPLARLPLLGALGLVLAAGAAQADDGPRLIRSEMAAKVAESVSPARLRASIDALVGFGTRHTLSETADPKRGIGAARNWLKGAFEGASGPGRREFRALFDCYTQRPTQRVPREVEVCNVVAILPGKARQTKDAPPWPTPAPGERFVYVLAHYDSRNGDPLDAVGDSPGANDDGSGTAAVLELATLLTDPALVGTGLECTVVLVATAGEEQSLLGATHLANLAATHQHVIAGVLSMDIVGDPTGTPTKEGIVPSDSTRIRVFSEGLPRVLPAEPLSRMRANSAESDSASRGLARFVADVARAQQTRVSAKLVFRPDRFLRGGDHSPFNDAGFAAVRFTQVFENYDRQHQDVKDPAPDGRVLGDLARFVDVQYLAGVTGLVGAAAVHLANAPSPPPLVTVLTRDLAQDSTLRWTKSPEVDVVGYEVVWRETTSPEWTNVLAVGDTTKVTVPVSKDDCFLGVRAVDREGYKSMVTPAVAGRE